MGQVGTRGAGGGHTVCVGGKMGRQMGPPSTLPLPSQGRWARWAHMADQPLRALSVLPRPQTWAWPQAHLCD